MSEHQHQSHPQMLLVEDDRRMVGVFVDILAPLGIEVVPAMSRAAAEPLIGGEYQVAVCDLQIPSRDGWLDASADHGMSVINQLRSEQPIMPILVFSGLGSTRMDEKTDGEGLKYFTKSQLPECLAEVKEIVGMTGHKGAASRYDQRR